MRKRTKKDSSTDSAVNILQPQPSISEGENNQTSDDIIGVIKASSSSSSSSSSNKLVGNVISAKSDFVSLREKKAQGKDLKLLHKKVEEPEDGRVISHDSTKSNGWRKLEFTLDQQMPICKDFHDTGYCTYGGACKYLHTREEVTTSSQMDKKSAWKKHLAEISQREKEKAKRGEVMLEPDICQICHKLLNDPVITKCDHKFCSSCAMRRYLSDHKCAICGKDTEGIFNTAPK